MVLLGVADCCWIAHLFAFTASSVLLTSITFCFDLPVLASFKRQTNGNVLHVVFTIGQEVQQTFVSAKKIHQAAVLAFANVKKLCQLRIGTFCPRVASSCVLLLARIKNLANFFHRTSRRRGFDTALQNSFAESPRPAAILALDFLRSLCSRGERARTRLSTSSSSTGETRTATALPFRVMTTGPSVWDFSI